MACLAHDARREGDLAVRAGADSEVVAVGPVIQVVTRLSAAQRVRGRLVVLVTRVSRQLLDHLLHSGSRVVVGHDGWVTMEVCVRFNREVVERQMGRRVRERTRNIGLRLRDRLPRQAVHEIEIEVLEVLASDIDRMRRLHIVMNAAE